MKNLKFNPKNFAFNFAVIFMFAALLFGASLEVAIGSAGVALFTGSVLSLANFPKAAFMAIQVEIWQNVIEQEIFKDNSFLRLSRNADENVINSKVVHIPQSGGSGNVVKNRTTVPATVRKRTDTDIVYALDEYTTDPIYIPHADTKELSYDKTVSALGEDRDKLVQTIAEVTLYNWTNSPAVGAYTASVIPAGNVKVTTGASSAASAPGATGTRKAAALVDLQAMSTFFRTKNRWFDGKMNALIPPVMLAQMFPADSQITATYMQATSEAERRNGMIMKAQGWNIYTRSSVAVVKASGDVAAPGEASAVTDNEAALFWYSDAVEFAFGGVEAFEKLGDPQFYGDVYSFLARTGSRAVRQGYEGVALLKQAFLT